MIGSAADRPAGGAVRRRGVAARLLPVRRRRRARRGAARPRPAGGDGVVGTRAGTAGRRRTRLVRPETVRSRRDPWPAAGLDRHGGLALVVVVTGPVLVRAADRGPARLRHRSPWSGSVRVALARGRTVVPLRSCRGSRSGWRRLWVLASSARAAARGGPRWPGRWSWAPPSSVSSSSRPPSRSDADGARSGGRASPTSSRRSRVLVLAWSPSLRALRRRPGVCLVTSGGICHDVAQATPSSGSPVEAPHVSPVENRRRVTVASRRQSRSGPVRRPSSGGSKGEWPDGRRGKQARPGTDPRRPDGVLGTRRPGPAAERPAGQAVRHRCAVARSRVLGLPAGDDPLGRGREEDHRRPRRVRGQPPQLGADLQRQRREPSPRRSASCPAASADAVAPRRAQTATHRETHT